MQALAFPFDLHVLSTPPAFILSQDQTLHKKRFRKKQAVKSPIPNQKQTNQHPNRRRTGKNPKITRFNNRPQPDGVIKQGRSKYVKHVQPHPTHTMNQKDDAISHWNSTTPPPAHTQTQGAHHTVHKKGRQTHPRNKSTLAHYRVLKQHQHTHQPEPNTAPAGKSGFVRSYTTNQPQVKLTLNPG